MNTAMNIPLNIPKGKYVVAVSGGVDSMVLLDILAKNRQLNLIVAHFNHGIRKDSHVDEVLVKKICDNRDLVFVSGQGNLGKDASEEKARDARYAFLSKVLKDHNAKAIITAHHQDDLIETSIINLLRGTNRRGLTALQNKDDILRPLLLYPKVALVEYAKSNHLQWREDSTNKDKKYLRNFVRLEIVSKMTSLQRIKWLKILDAIEKRNKAINTQLEFLFKKSLHRNQMVLNRKWFCLLPHIICKEVVAGILYKMDIKNFDKKTIERLAVQIKTLPAGKTIQLVRANIYLTKRSARFKNR